MTIFFFLIWIDLTTVEASGGNDDEKAMMGMLDESKGNLFIRLLLLYKPALK